MSESQPIESPKEIERPRIGRPKQTQISLIEFSANDLDKVTKLCKLGSTNEDLAELFEVGVGTISRWISESESFADSVFAGRLGADSEVAASLYQRAIGYDCIEQKGVVDRFGDEHLFDLKKHIPGDVGAITMWLKNRQRKYWSDKFVVDLNAGAEGQARIVDMLQSAMANLIGLNPSTDGQHTDNATPKRVARTALLEGKVRAIDGHAVEPTQRGSDPGMPEGQVKEPSGR